ncbi:hypothetical protein OsJ_26430 [Oryza sativa Japonica Group]|uniref:Uncharacterized protein n=1 Tax=Oryza sativa subsp. japonica TaxID=39947 RepID=A3BQP4_ORYSJ|nr:hypothetical protein OsJ_26430 [Oryza sativa Japonica Group]
MRLRCGGGFEEVRRGGGSESEERPRCAAVELESPPLPPATADHARICRALGRRRPAVLGDGDLPSRTATSPPLGDLDLKDGDLPSPWRRGPPAGDLRIPHFSQADQPSACEDRQSSQALACPPKRQKEL